MSKKWFMILGIFLVLSMFSGFVKGELVVDLVSIPSNLNSIESELNNIFDGYCLYSDPNGWNTINNSTSYIKFDVDSPIYFNSLTITQVNETQGNVSFTIGDIPYYKSPGDYTLICNIFDDVNTSQGSDDITINTLLASDVNVTSLSFGSTLPGSIGYTPYFKVENTGNVDFNSSWKGTNFTNVIQIPINNCNITTTLGWVIPLTEEFQQFDKSILVTYSYIARFSLYVPFGTPSGIYTNTFIHGVS